MELNNYRLTICQKISGLKDMITPILLHDEKTVLKNLPITVKNPVVYYSTKENKNYFFINYLIYHPFDWSDSPIKFIRDVDSHRHDTESACLRIDKEYGIADICTVYHHSHKFAWAVKNLIVVSEDKSHALRPVNSLPEYAKHPFIVYYPDSYRLEDFSKWSEEKLNVIKIELNKHGVNWLDQQFDQDLKLKTCRKDFRHEPGDIIKNPDKLFKLAQKYNR